MAQLTADDRSKIWRGVMRYWSRLQETTPGVTKQDILDAVNATDTWIDDNQGSYNAALPLAFRSNATLAQKTLLFCVVAAMRVSNALAKLILGEVD